MNIRHIPQMFVLGRVLYTLSNYISQIWLYIQLFAIILLSSFLLILNIIVPKSGILLNNGQPSYPACIRCGRSPRLGGPIIIKIVPRSRFASYRRLPFIKRTRTNNNIKELNSGFIIINVAYLSHNMHIHIDAYIQKHVVICSK